MQKKLYLLFFIISIIHVVILFSDAGLLAGGDHHYYLRLFRTEIYPYAWNIRQTLGTQNFSLPDILGLELYSTLFGLFRVSPEISQRILLAALFFFKMFSISYLARILFKNLSFTALILLALFYTFNPFTSLDPFSLLPLLFSIYMPLSLGLFVQLLSMDKIGLRYLALLFITSVVFSSVGANPPLYFVVFIPQAIYLLTRFTTLKKVTFVNLVLYFVSQLISMLWWLYPLLGFYTQNAANLGSANTFSAVNSSSLNDSMLLIGHWAWRQSNYLHPYFPFSTFYDNFVVQLISTLLLFGIFFSIFHLVSRGVKYSTLVIGLIFLGLFLAKGTQPPLGSLYSFLNSNLAVFAAYREPFTKFTWVYLLGLSLGIGILVSSIKQLSDPKKRKILLGLVTLSIFLFGSPVYFGFHVGTLWNGGTRSLRISIPSYWKNYKEFAKSNLTDANILIFPKTQYGTAWNWPKGFNSADDVSADLLDSNTRVLRSVSILGSSAAEFIDSVYNLSELYGLDEDALNLLGINYVLLEGDIDWRFINSTASPDEMRFAFSQTDFLEEISSFGVFTEEYLKSIPNDHPIQRERDLLYENLTQLPILSLYKNTLSSKNNLFYFGEHMIYSSGSPETVARVLFDYDFKDIPVFVEQDSALSTRSLVVDIVPEDTSHLCSVCYSMDVPVKGTYTFNGGTNELGLTATSSDTDKGIDLVHGMSYELFGEYTLRYTDPPQNKVIAEVPLDITHQNYAVKLDDYASPFEHVLKISGESKENTLYITLYEQDESQKAVAKKFWSFDPGPFVLNVTNVASPRAKDAFLLFSGYPAIKGRPALDVAVQDVDYYVPVQGVQYLTNVSISDSVKNEITVSVKKYNPTRYLVQFDAPVDQGVLVFRESFDPGWEALANDVTLKHIKVNSYANGWEIDSPTSAIEIQYKPQKVFSFLFGMMLLAFGASLVYVLYDFRKNRQV